MAPPGRGGCRAVAQVGGQAGPQEDHPDLRPDGWRDQGLDLSWGGGGGGTCPCVSSWS